MTDQEIEIKIICFEAKSKALKIQGFEDLSQLWQERADTWKEILERSKKALCKGHN